MYVLHNLSCMSTCSYSPVRRLSVRHVLSSQRLPWELWLAQRRAQIDSGCLQVSWPRGRWSCERSTSVERWGHQRGGLLWPVGRGWTKDRISCVHVSLTRQTFLPKSGTRDKRACMPFAGQRYMLYVCMSVWTSSRVVITARAWV